MQVLFRETIVFLFWKSYKIHKMGRIAEFRDE
jgi:hypothetical protein